MTKRTCIECDRPAKSRGYCSSHYMIRWKRGEFSRRTLAERLQRLSEPDRNGCVLWTGAVNNVGYGKITIGGRSIGAHRASYEVAKGSIPDGMHVMHLCDVPRCINPSHLSLGTSSENALDRERKGRGRHGQNPTPASKALPV